MAHPRGEVLSFPPLRFVRGEYQAADLDRLVALYRPLLPRPAGIENVALMGPLLYHTTGRFELDSLGDDDVRQEAKEAAGKREYGLGAGRARPDSPTHLEVLELYRGRQRPQYRIFCSRRYSLGLWAVGLNWLEGCLDRPERVSLMTQRLTLLAAPVLKVGRKKRNFHRLQMAHRARILGYGIGHLLPLDYSHITPSGGAMLVLDTLLHHDPAMASQIAAAFITSPQSQRNRNALYRRVNWLMEKYPSYRRAGYKGGEPAYRLLDHTFEPDPEGGWTRRTSTALGFLRATLPMVLGGGGNLAAQPIRSRFRGLFTTPPTCSLLFDHEEPVLKGYLGSRTAPQL